MPVEKSPRPTGEELETTEKMLIKIVQSEAFDTTKSVIEGLRVVRDEEGIVRVSTKIVRREDTTSFRFPALLPHTHPLVDLIIQKEHLQNVHGGAQLLMSKLREKFWIVRGRQAVVKVIRQCVKCKRFDGKKFCVKPCPLPEPRVRGASAFEVTGIDLAGPLSLKNKKKCYIVLFTCAVYRGVHLEVTESLSTEDFLLCFVRFCKRKQRPSIVYTDNGTNFVGAVNLFKKIDWEKVKQETQQQRINWIFNPPSAPWWGGWWERLVRSTKDLLRKSLGFGKLSLGQLETALCEVEAAINHRPLTYVTEDPEDFVPLTPAMFMHNLPYSGVPESSVVIVPTLKKEQKNLQQLHQEIRDRFRSEYLGQLIQRGKEQKIREFKIGEVVLVEVDNQKRIFWPMAKIVELLPGKDGEVRVARIRTKNGTQLRPIQRLIPLEIRHDVTEFVTEEEPKSGVKKSITKPRKLQEQESSVEELDMEVESDPVVTRSGRQVRKPKRFTFS